ncbi:MAG: rhodanese-like domain-containing protein [Desulfobacteraceae bacterium]|nr:rhodanese-like domain-containing protein [Desulfobacteraceae bacterium]
MKILIIMETIQNFLDVGMISEIIRNSFKYRFEMDLSKIVKYFFFGRGYSEITPPQLMETMAQTNLFIVDLRDKKSFKKAHIKDSIFRFFDDYLKDIFVFKAYREYQDRQIVLVCNTGHLSRVAASIMAEQGFKKIYSLKGGIRRWTNWQKLIHRYSFLRQIASL